MLTALLGLLTIAAPLGAVDARALAASARHHDAPGIRVWISSRDLFHRGDRARVYYRTERDAFVTVLRVDTDGRVDVLYPRSPDDDNYAYGGTTYSVNRVGRNEAFGIDREARYGRIEKQRAGERGADGARKHEQRALVRPVIDAGDHEVGAPAGGVERARPECHCGGG